MSPVQVYFYFEGSGSYVLLPAEPRHTGQSHTDAWVKKNLEDFLVFSESLCAADCVVAHVCNVLCKL